MSLQFSQEATVNDKQLLEINQELEIIAEDIMNRFGPEGAYHLIEILDKAISEDTNF